MSGKPPYKHVPITVGEDTVAIAVGDNAPANAAHIVHCVNTHDELCEALKHGDSLRQAATAYFMCLSGEELRRFERMVMPTLEAGAEKISSALAVLSRAQGGGK